MARAALVAVVLAFLFIQLASSQDNCQNALTALNDAVAGDCRPTSANPRIICDSPCSDYYEDVFDRCSPEVDYSCYIVLKFK